MTDADLCRANDWQPGTVLVGDEGYGPETIVLTAIGESCVLARQIRDRHGLPVDDIEEIWTLQYRDWKPDDVV